MKITYSKLSWFLVNVGSFSSVLLYGENTGKILSYLKTITQKIGCRIDDPFNTTVLSFKEILVNPYLLLDAASTLPLNHNKVKLLYVTDVGESLPPATQKILLQCTNYDHVYVIFTSKLTLSTQSRTRLFFEKEKKYAIVACYPDEGNGLQHLIKDYLQQNHCAYDHESIQVLSHSLEGSDRLNVYSELEKLIAYTGNKKYITAQDCINCLISEPKQHLHNICLAFADKNIQEFLILIDRQKDMMLVIRALTKYFLRIYQVIIKVQSGTTSQEAINFLKPPVFFKNLPKFKSHLNMWTLNNVVSVLERLLEAEIEYKKGSALSKPILQNLALNFKESTIV